MIARITDIPADQQSTWGAVLAVLRYEHRDDLKFHWRAVEPKDSARISFIEIETPGEDVDALRAEIDEIVTMVNAVADRDPLKLMKRAEPGLVEVLVS